MGFDHLHLRNLSLNFWYLLSRSKSRLQFPVRLPPSQNRCPWISEKANSMTPLLPLFGLLVDVAKRSINRGHEGTNFDRFRRDDSKVNLVLQRNIWGWRNCFKISALFTPSPTPRSENSPLNHVGLPCNCLFLCEISKFCQIVHTRSIIA